jgi:hypothetical protein
VRATLYDQDFYAWANEQARLLRAGKLSEADIEHIAEEIESMGRTEKRELISRLTVLLLHLLKWEFQPDRRGASWEATIHIQRRDLADHLDDNPSLTSKLEDAVVAAYDRAIYAAAAETDLPRQTFPAMCPWAYDQITNKDFWPGGSI